MSETLDPDPAAGAPPAADAPAAPVPAPGPGAPAPVAPARGLVARIAWSWSGRHRALLAADVAAGISESRLLAYAMGVGLLMLVANLPGALAERAEAIAAGLTRPSAGELAIMTVVADLFFLPLWLYAVAAGARLLARLFGGRGGWQATRQATFWSFLAAGPALLLAGAASSLVAIRGGAADLARIPDLLAGVVLLWFLVQGVGEVHGFRRPWIFFAGFLGLCALATAVAFALSAGAPA